MDEPRKAWKEFEEAVARFLAALDKSATVSHDVAVPDKDTGEPRQRDVWIETKALAHFPIKILVSCKRWQAKLDVQDMDAFIGEWQSSGAQVGVVYSYSGFTESALRKAKARGISCCRLIVGSDPELPPALAIPSYCFTPRTRLQVNEDVLEGSTTSLTWRDIFDTRIPSSKDDQLSVLDAVVETFQALESQARTVKPPAPYPESLAAQIVIPDSPFSGATLRVTVELSWACYRGDVTAYLVDGSYCETSGEFLGSQAFPWVDLRGPTPGPAWTLVTYPPETSDSVAVFILYGGDVRQSMLSNLADQPLRRSK